MDLTREKALEKIEELKLYIKHYDKSKIERLIEKYGTTIRNRSIVSCGNYIKIPLPTCNVGWTFEAFDYVKKIVKGESENYEVYPEHRIDNDNTNFLWIRVKNKWR